MHPYSRYFIKSFAALLAFYGANAAVGYKIGRVTDDMVANSDEETFVKTSNRATIISIVGVLSSSAICFVGLCWTISKFKKEYEASL